MNEKRCLMKLKKKENMDSMQVYLDFQRFIIRTSFRWTSITSIVPTITSLIGSTIPVVPVIVTSIVLSIISAFLIIFTLWRIWSSGQLSSSFGSIKTLC